MSDQLLYAISSKGQLKMENFYALFRVLQNHRPTELDRKIVTDPRHHAIRMLESLGHCEFDFGARKVWICPPILVLIPSSGLPKAVLTGARSPALIKKLKQAVAKTNGAGSFKLIQLDMGEFGLPAAICIEAVSKDLLRKIAENAGISHDLNSPAAWKLINLSVSLEELIQTLKFEERTEVNWPKRIFMPNHLTFLRTEEKPSGSISLIEYRNPVDQQLNHLLWEGNRSAEVDRDWARYFILNRNRRSVLLYDERRFRFAVPITTPPPCLISRALILCTGIAPTKTQIIDGNVGSLPPGHPMLIYQGVPPLIAEMVFKKTGQPVQKAIIDPDEKGIRHA